jgi:CxxC motif-containing protein (DUF1111 family)
MESPTPANRTIERQRVALGVLLFVPVIALGCERLLTTEPDPGERFDQPFANLGAGELGRFLEGRTQFRRGFSINEGLGPIFNNRACAACPSGDGRGLPQNMLTRFSRGGDLVVGEGGPQLQERAIPGTEPETLPSGCDLSHRLPPPVFGMGLIEAIPEAAILAHADESDADGDGISGRPNLVPAASYVPLGEPGGAPGLRVGRFGRKAQVPALLQQAVEAYHQDMGITSPFQPAEIENVRAAAAGSQPDRVSDPEIGMFEVGAVLNYLRRLAPPAPGEWNDTRRHGADVFTAIKCATCHVPSLRSGVGVDSLDATSNQDVLLYADLLLHDLGDALADGRPDGDANGREWRSAPLWGMRLVPEFLNGRTLLLHDGRAHSVDEAIRLHGGEAQGVRDAYLALPQADRDALLEFVESR